MEEIQLFYDLLIINIISPCSKGQIEQLDLLHMALVLSFYPYLV